MHNRIVIADDSRKKVLAQYTLATSVRIF